MKRLICLTVLLVSICWAANRPFHFSADPDTAKAKVTVEQANRMVDDIYSNFDGKGDVIRVSGYQFVGMMVGIDPLGYGGITEQIVKIHDANGRSVRFKDRGYKMVFSERAAWKNGERQFLTMSGYWYPLTDSSFVIAIPYDDVWDTLDVLLFGEMK